MVPEVLFNPSDIGLQQMGIPEAIALGRQSEKKNWRLKEASVLDQTI